MPRFDGTGPVGRGAMTGWGRGDCIMPIRQAGEWLGRGLGRGFGCGLGLRSRRWAATTGGVSIGEELAQLREQVAELQKSLQHK